MSDQDERIIQRQVALGKMAEEFLSSELGQHCRDMAEFEKEVASAALFEVDPRDEKEISRLQQMAKRHNDFDRWLMELVEVGHLAYEQYIEENSD